MPQSPGLQASFLIALDDLDLGGEAAQRFQQDIDAAALGELIGAAQGGQDPLHGAFALPMVLHDLEIAVRTFGLDSDKHAAPPSGHHNNARVYILLSGKLLNYTALF